MATRIYTRGGDKGQTGLWGGARVSKDNLRVAAYGDVDELNATIGVALAQDTPASIAETLARVQRQLFDLGAELATPPGKDPPSTVGDEEITWLESAIDAAENELPTLKSFILPGGVPLAASLHVARTVCRRAERACVSLRQAEPESSPEPVRFLNRLSDLFFVLARLANHRAGQSDVAWGK